METKTVKKEVKFSLTAYLNILKISERDKFVVKKILHTETEEKTASDWKNLLSTKCKGIIIKK